jgi:hypothetical protein
MTVKNLNSLVLRGISVLRDGVAVDARLGFSYLAVSQPREVCISSMRHGGCTGSIESERWERVHNPPAGNPTPRTGRSGSQSGVHLRRTPTTVGGRVTEIIGQPWNLGGSQPTAAAVSGRLAVPVVASVGKTDPASFPALFAGSLAARLWPCATATAGLSSRNQSYLWAKRDTRTQPVSTRGKTGR